jgi:hypothetical protein
MACRPADCRLIGQSGRVTAGVVPGEVAPTPSRRATDHPKRRLMLGLAAVGVAAVSAAGCSSDSSSPAATRTVTVTASASSAAASASSSSATPTPTVSLVTKIDGTCESLLSLYDVGQAAGRQLGGTTAFIVGLPDKSIGRLGYLNCRYGIPSGATGAAAVPQVEIGVSLYDTPARAERRASSTAADYVANGAKPTQLTVAGHPGVMLAGGRGTGYTVPLLVAATGQRTVAVSVALAGASTAQQARIASAIASLALTRTGG